MANIFSQAKDLYKLQQEARAMQKKMKAIEVVGKSRNSMVEIRVNGIHEIVGVDVSEELLEPTKKRQLEASFQEAFKEAEKLLQKELMKDMDLEKMKSLLG